MKNIKKLIALIMAAAVGIALFTGCGSDISQETDAPMESPPAETTQAPEDSSSPTSVPSAEPDHQGLSDTISKLCDDTEDISIWTSTLMSIELNTSSINELTAIQEYEKKTNVHIDWQQASSAGAAEQFGIMVASGDYSDIIIGLENYYTGGMSGALNEGVIISLTDIIDEYAPNYMGFVRSDENVLREVKTDDGQFLALYSVYDSEYTPTSGPMVRQDWLDALGLDVPVTYDDYYNVAAAFKTEYGCSDPIMMLSTLAFSTSANNTCGYLSGGYGTVGFSYSLSGVGAIGLYNDNGVIKSSLLEDGYRKYLEMLKSWYDAGIISSDFISNPNTTMSPDYSAVIAANETGIFCGDAVNMNDYGSQSSDPSFSLTAAGAAKASASDGPNAFGIDTNRRQGGSAVISSECENVELAMNWLDNWFTDEGSILANYGVEGLANEVGSDGIRRYTDTVLNNPNGLSQMAATVIYSVTFIPTISTQETRFSIWENNVLEAVATWNDSVDGSGIIPGVSLTMDESAQYTQLASVIQTYASENVIKFVVGSSSFDDYDSYIQELLNLGIQDCIDIYQDAFDRYSNR